MASRPRTSNRFVSALMVIAYISFVRVNESGLEAWLDHISFFTREAEALAKKATVHSIHHLRTDGTLTRNNVHYHFIRTRWYDRVLPLAAIRRLRELQPDAVLVHGLIFPFQVLLIAIFCSNVLIGAINHAERPLRHVRRWLQLLADRFISCYFFTSREAGSAWVTQGLIRSSAKIHEVMIGASVFSRIAGNSLKARAHDLGAPVYLWVGGLDANKDPLTVIAAFTDFARGHSGAVLYMVFRTNDLLAEVNAALELNPCPRIHLVGQVPHQQLQAWYNGTDFIISSSHYEGGSIALCEAMSCGCIPIVSAIPSSLAMTGRGACGMSFAPGDRTGLLNVLRQSASLDMAIEKEKVLAVYEQKLSADATARKVLSLLSGPFAATRTYDRKPVGVE